MPAAGVWIRHGAQWMCEVEHYLGATLLRYTYRSHKNNLRLERGVAQLQLGECMLNLLGLKAQCTYLSLYLSFDSLIKVGQRCEVTQALIRLQLWPVPMDNNSICDECGHVCQKLCSTLLLQLLLYHARETLSAALCWTGALGIG